jgi:hypothetical protein
MAIKAIADQFTSKVLPERLQHLSASDSSSTAS